MSGSQRRPRLHPTVRSLLVGTGGTILLGTLFLWLDQGSLEQGNRLFQEGDPEAAAALYRRHADDPEAVQATYNLGTALLSIDPDEAEERLRAATVRADSLVAHRAFHNLGYRFLTAAGAVEADSAVTLLLHAIESQRQAVRLEPRDANSRWNLAVAERMLDSIGHRPLEPQYEVSPGEDETRIDLTALVRSETGEGASGLEPETPNPGEATGERQAPRQGARESWTTQDPGPLDAAAAWALLARARDEPEAMIRGLLWAHRPDVAWWNQAPYPGGGW